jgi:hypothetical protein
VIRLLALPVALPLALLVSATAFGQEGVAPHLEGCLMWNTSGHVTVRNECSRPMTIMFMTFADQHVSSVDLAAGGHAQLGAEWGQPDGFMFTACPPNYIPSLRFSLENKEAISVSLYNCVSGRPNS